MEDSTSSLGSNEFDEESIGSSDTDKEIEQKKPVKSVTQKKGKKPKKVKSPTGLSHIFTPESEKNIEHLDRQELEDFLKKKLEQKEKYEGLLEETNGVIVKDPSCVRKYSNFSFPASNSIYNLVDYYPNAKAMEFHEPKNVEDIKNIIRTETFENIPNTYSPDNLQIVAPKLNTLMQKIRNLDEKDMAVHGKLFKHFIFSDGQPSMSGVKLIASALIANGFNLGYSAEPKYVNMKRKKPKNKSNKAEAKNDGGDDATINAFDNITLKSNEQLLQSPFQNFHMLSSKTVYGKPIPIPMRKEILKTFNSRPDNIGGELSRIIIMDGGFKEGIDLFDIKYVHIFEPTITKSDQTQVIGRGTRTCGQKGLDFHPRKGWPLYVYVYDLNLSQYPEYFSENESTGISLLLQAMGVNMQLLNFYAELENIAIESAVDNQLNRKIHSFKASNVLSNSYTAGAREKKLKGAPKPTSTDMLPVRNVLPNTWLFGNRHNGELTYTEMDNYVNTYLSEYTWDNLVMKNNCVNVTDLSAPPNIPRTSPDSELPALMGGTASYADAYDQKIFTLGPQGVNSMSGGAGGEIMNFTPTQGFVSSYFTPGLPLKGMLLWHSVGTGKTCSAIATASSFEEEGYTILWVTRTTLKNDIWKNMFDQVCSIGIQDKIRNGLVMPNDMAARKRLLPKSWKIQPMSYKQFSNLVSKQNKMYEEMVKINGTVDPLRKTLIVIDEAHKLYGGGDLSSLEQPDMVAFHNSVMNSYRKSGLDSVRLLLMTATPIQKDPMELIKILNLTKTPDDQFPDTFDQFSAKYLNHEGKFTAVGVAEFMDEVSGHISYLNREKDARQFSQPVIKQVEVNVMPRHIQQKIKRGIMKQYKYYVDNIKKNITQKERDMKNTKSDNEKLQNIEKHFIHTVCDNRYVGKTRTACKKKLRELTKEIKEESKEKLGLLKESIGVDKQQIIQLKEMKKNDVANSLDEIYDKDTSYLTQITPRKLGIPKGVLSQLAYKCSKKDSSSKGFIKYMKEHSPDIAIAEETIDGLSRDIKNAEKLYSKEKDKTLKKQLKDDILTMKENYATTKKNRSVFMKKARSALKKQTKIANTRYKNAQKETKKALKEINKQENFENSIEEINENLQKYVDKLGDITNSLEESNQEDLKKQQEKEEKKLEKQKVKEEKERAKTEKNILKEQAKMEKERAKTEKNMLKEQAKKEKERAKTEKAKAKAESTANKTRKNKKM